jgi:hypothetical protein
MMMERSYKNSEKGQATLEFLIIVPLMLLMISLVLFAGWWSYGKLSAQNAAYSYGIWAPRVQRGISVARLANIEASSATLRDAIGMKPMWADDIPNSYPSKLYGDSRLGGTGLTVAVSPREVAWAEWIDAYMAIGAPESNLDMPRATAFFFYSPFMSSNQ